VTQLNARAVARAGLLERYRADSRTAWLVATGRSMEPLIPAGSRLLVEFGAQPARIGDVILFRGRHGTVAHRLVAHRRSGDALELIAKGDHEALADPGIPVDAVLGVVREVRRPDGRPGGVGLDRRRGPLLARISWWSGRVARLCGRAGRRLPTPVRVPAIAATRFLSRVPTRVVTAIIPRLDRGDSAGRR